MPGVPAQVPRPQVILAILHRRRRGAFSYRVRCAASACSPSLLKHHLHTLKDTVTCAGTVSQNFGAGMRVVATNRYADMDPRVVQRIMASKLVLHV